MNQQDTRFENEFEQELPPKTMDEFNTLQSFSVQPTSLLETTLTDTLGLSMHNAVTNQQQSHMTTAASVTNACARLLQTRTYVPSASSSKDKTKGPSRVASNAQAEAEDEPAEVVQKSKGKLSLFGFLKNKKGAKDEQQE